jgi:hypothetical protein
MGKSTNGPIVPYDPKLERKFYVVKRIGRDNVEYGFL